MRHKNKELDILYEEHEKLQSEHDLLKEEYNKLEGRYEVLWKITESKNTK